MLQFLVIDCESTLTREEEQGENDPPPEIPYTEEVASHRCATISLESWKSAFIYRIIL